MSGIHTSIVKDAHAYTRSRVPWLLDAAEAAQDETRTGAKVGWKLFHYISGGGMKTFGRTIQQEEADVKRNRFLVKAAVLGAVWLWFYFS